MNNNAAGLGQLGQLFGPPQIAQPVMLIPLDPANDPLFLTKLSMIMKLINQCGLDLQRNQVQQLLIISSDLLIRPTKICDVTNSQIDEIVAQHNRSFGRNNPGCTISVESTEKLKALAQLFRKLEYQGINLSTYNPTDIDQAKFDDAVEDLKSVTAITKAATTTKILTYAPDEEFAYWLASVMVALDNVIGAYQQPITYVAAAGDPNSTEPIEVEARSVPEGPKKVQDSKKAFEIVSESLLSSSTGRSILMLFQPTQDGIGLMQYLRRINEGEGGRVRTMEILSEKISAMYTGTSSELKFSKFRQNWELYWMHVERGGNVLMDNFKKERVHEKLSVPGSNTKFWLKAEAAKDEPSRYTIYMGKLAVAVVTCEVEKNMG
ncbi:hypothetical protein THAOC_13948 [Thalassiosira oceanica]|uniref:Uncharacterized protein n=1 Tax=Thalassiosira oceanica TaxID=159749 RepID=K0SW85_THAOC|nr:hypothetical protein THAOC_13948 [Thalassiosira oceanica]|eukprot:EJK65221.1 hypothetical protein THAOC_13948 [Thalassiosira oceanica]